MVFSIVHSSLSELGPVRPGMRYGPTPLRKRSSNQSTWLDRCVTRLVVRGLSRRRKIKNSWLHSIQTTVLDLEQLSEAELDKQFKQLSIPVSRKGHHDQSMQKTLAHAVVRAKTTLALEPRDCQLNAVRALLQGRFVEMGTGEGKTLTMALGAAVTALDGTPVHVLTSSDYLAERDATLLAAFYGSMGLSVAHVLPGMSDAERRQAYQANVVHVTGKQVAFDWLRDRVASNESTQRLASRLGYLTQSPTDANAKPLLRGLCLAIVDEADSLLIDEARTPLVLSASVRDKVIKGEESVVALTLARLLKIDVDFTVSASKRVVTLTPEGANELNALAKRFDGLWRATRYRDEKVREALTVLHCWFRDRDYVVRDKRIELVDQYTGRALPDRRLPHGLHTLLELKERCEATAENDVVASIPFQHFFLSYIKLTGMSGTLREVRGELACVYGAEMVGVPPHKPTQLRILSEKVVSSTSVQLELLLQEVRQCQKNNRPVLIGTQSVQQSEMVSAELRRHNIPHNLLHAAQDADEAAVVAEAGRPGQVTVATNMAGRGTDIRVGPEVSASGGLHVIGLAFNDSCRIDRQLAGRAGRQGDPGTFLRLLSLDDQSVANVMPNWIQRGITRLLTVIESHQQESAHDPVDRRLRYGSAVVNHVALVILRQMQRRIEGNHATERQRALDACRRIAHQVAIGAGMDFTR